jgi:hypothetical protein
MQDNQVITDEGPLSVILNTDGKSETVSNFHIKSVEVFTGDDSYNQTFSITTQVGINGALVQSMDSRKLDSKYRLRDEPAARILLESEDGPRIVLSVCHHKGQVYIDAEAL